jgi:hypothetical protein
MPTLVRFDPLRDITVFEEVRPRKVASEAGSAE